MHQNNLMLTVQTNQVKLAYQNHHTEVLLKQAMLILSIHQVQFFSIKSFRYALTRKNTHTFNLVCLASYNMPIEAVLPHVGRNAIVWYCCWQCKMILFRQNSKGFSFHCNDSKKVLCKRLSKVVHDKQHKRACLFAAVRHQRHTHIALFPYQPCVRIISDAIPFRRV